MNRKIFIGIIISDNNKPVKALGIEKDMETEDLKKINTEDLSEKAAATLVYKCSRVLQKVYPVELLSDNNCKSLK